MLRVYLFFSFVLTLLFSFKFGHSQLRVEVGERFMDGISVKKVHVNVEDHAVFTITKDGKVYYKLQDETYFSIYPLTSAYTVTDITGFNKNEMYFVTDNKLLKVYYDNPVFINLPIEVTKINNIAVFYGVNRENRTKPFLSFKDYVSIATNNSLYYALRTDDQVGDMSHYTRVLDKPQPNWKILQSSYNTLDFQYEQSNDYCSILSDHVYQTDMNEYLYVTRVMDKAPYPTKVNATVLGFHSYYPAGSWIFYNNLWATDDGVFVLDPSVCNQLVISKHLQGQKVSSLARVFALTPIYKQDFVFAGTNNGIYYTSNSIFFEMPGQAVKKVEFLKVNNFDNVEVNDIKVETDVKEIIVSGDYNYNIVCEKVLWVATETGVNKLYLTLEQDYYDQLKFNMLVFNKSPSNADWSNPVFEICGTQKVTVNAQLPTTKFENQVLLKWYKNGVEVPELVGKNIVDLYESGTYYLKALSLCENISINSFPIVVKNNVSPEITFNYPSVVEICNGTSYYMETKSVSNYVYRWFKDEVLIPNANQYNFRPSTTGIYRVEVSNCSGVFETSRSVSIIVKNIPLPLLISNKTYYCDGENAELSVENSLNYKIHWFLNGVPLPEANNQKKITLKTVGTYTVSFSDGVCSSLLSSYTFIQQKPVIINIVKSTNKNLCYGDKIVLMATEIVGANYIWNTGETSRTIEVSKTGKYFVNVKMGTGCTGVSEEVEIFIPNVPLFLPQPKDELICTATAEEVLLEAPMGFLFYYWNGVKSISNQLKVAQPGVYNLDVEDEFGCKVSTSYKVLPYCKTIIAPNTFSPNDDGINDFWRISGLENDLQAVILIYNRFGKIAYKTNGAKPFWNGKIDNNVAPIGVYYYLIQTKNSNKPINGTINLIR